MIAIDSITQLINRAAEAGIVLCRGSELQPEATTGFSSGECLNEGRNEMSEPTWEEVLGNQLEKLESQEELAQSLAAKVCGEHYTQEQFGFAYAVVRQRALLQEAEAELRKSAE